MGGGGGAKTLPRKAAFGAVFVAQHCHLLMLRFRPLSYQAYHIPNTCEYEQIMTTSISTDLL